MPDDTSPMRPEPSKERLNAPSSRVIVKNTSEIQNHIVIDRFNVGHELRPGEAREMELQRLKRGWRELVRRIVPSTPA